MGSQSIVEHDHSAAQVYKCLLGMCQGKHVLAVYTSLSICVVHPHAGLMLMGIITTCIPLGLTAGGMGGALPGGFTHYSSNPLGLDQISLGHVLLSQGDAPSFMQTNSQFRTESIGIAEVDGCFSEN